jgi:DNA-directed RNA polymerase beta subunit
MKKVIAIHNTVYNDFNNLLHRSKAVASINRINADNTSAFAVICTKFNGERFEEAILQAIEEEEARERVVIIKSESLDYGYKLKIKARLYENENDEQEVETQEYELSYCTQY